MQIKYRQNKNKKNLELRAGILSSIRGFFNENGYLEVETPLLIPAPAPEAYIDALQSGNLFLHTSPELCMKRLLAAGFGRIFQICKVFRKNERGKKHLSEFTMLEWYGADMDYLDMMKQCESMLLYISEKCGFGSRILFQGRMIDLIGPWERITVKAAFDRYAGISLEEAMKTDESGQNKFDLIIAEKIEPELGKEKPVFLYDYPVEYASLARLKDDNPCIAERFELYIAGIELCNAFSELTDPVEQIKRFKLENLERKKQGKSEYPVSENFINSMPDMPQAAGNALGIDRLIMLFCDTLNIDDVVAFVLEEL